MVKRLTAALHAAESELVELRLALQNSEACRAAAERQANKLMEQIKAEARLAMAKDAALWVKNRDLQHDLDAARTDVERMVHALIRAEQTFRNLSGNDPRLRGDYDDEVIYGN